MAKTKVIKIKLNSSGQTKEGKPTGTYYTTTKNPQKKPEKLVKMKFDRRAYNDKTDKIGKHCEFKEGKIK